MVSLQEENIRTQAHQKEADIRVQEEDNHPQVKDRISQQNKICTLILELNLG